MFASPRTIWFSAPRISSRSTATSASGCTGTIIGWLPVANTTAERIAEWIGLRLRERIRGPQSSRIESLRIEVEENFGQWAICELPINEGNRDEGSS